MVCASGLDLGSLLETFVEYLERMGMKAPRELGFLCTVATLVEAGWHRSSVGSRGLLNGCFKQPSPALLVKEAPAPDTTSCL